jgi:hypothetical protein
MESGTPQQPEEKIVALEAKLTSTIKNFDKKVKFELNKGKNKGQNKSKGEGKVERKGTKSKGRSDDHPKMWAPPKSGEKKTREYKGHQWHWCGKDTGGNARSGVPTARMNARAQPLVNPVSRRANVQPKGRRRVPSRRSCVSLVPT